MILIFRLVCQLIVVSDKFYLQCDLPFPDPEIEQMKQASSEFILQIIRKGIEEKDIDPDIDSDLAVFMIETLINSISKYIPEKQSITTDKLAEEGALSLDTDVARDIFQQLIKILQFGLNSKSKSGQNYETKN